MHYRDLEEPYKSGICRKLRKEGGYELKGVGDTIHIIDDKHPEEAPLTVVFDHKDLLEVGYYDNDPITKDLVTRYLGG